MSARKFNADVRAAAAAAERGDIAGVTAVRRGESDGEVVITYHHASIAGPVGIRALAEDASEYPDGNNFMLFTDHDDLPQELMDAMDLAQQYSFGIQVKDLAALIARYCGSAFASGSQPGDSNVEDEVMTDCSEDDYDDEDDFMTTDDQYFGLAPQIRPAVEKQPATGLKFEPSPVNKALAARIRSDLQTAKDAGYRVGVLNSLGTSTLDGMASISIRVNKLCLSEDALEAWDVPQSDHVVLLIRYETRYVSLDKIIDLPVSHSGISMRIGLCKKYKPSGVEAREAFATSDQPGSPIRQDPDRAFRPLPLFTSLDQFMNESLIPLVKLRVAKKVSWDQANDILRRGAEKVTEEKGAAFGDIDEPSKVPEDGRHDYQTPMTPEEGSHDYHKILSPDHLMEGATNDCTVSFPLIAMQFAMKHFTKCTEYCLRCHRKMDEGFEALRPYVCSNPLCLFQYMAMGLGPNIEHEITTEPSVVDLLVTLCYAGLQSRMASRLGIRPAPAGAVPTVVEPGLKHYLREFPVGLQIRVPNIFPRTDGDADALLDPKPIISQSLFGTTMLLTDASDLPRLAPNRWVVLRYLADARSMIPTVTCFGIIRAVNLSQKTVEVQIIGQQGPCDLGSGTQWFPPVKKEVEIFPYDVEFDSLSNSQKAIAMRHLLDCLAPISQIQAHLLEHPKTPLRSCDIVPPAAVSLLQWIVSSNRSCIHEIGTLSGIGAAVLNGSRNFDSTWSVKEKRKNEHIPGMAGWIQFRFSQGSADKEVRFNEALRQVALRQDLSSYPTIFAWHGSSVANWHSILRTGLDSTEVHCGRAFGDGVYFSPNFLTSLSYSQTYAPPSWPNSALQIHSVMSLNEIINAPSEFVSRAPHYVVGDADWHQCRYLFVAPRRQDHTGSGIYGSLQTPEVEGAPVQMLPQAPGLAVTGPSGATLELPIASMPIRTAKPAVEQTPINYMKTLDDLNVDSDDDLAEDVEFFGGQAFVATSVKRRRSSSLDTILARPRKGKAPPTPVQEDNLTDFRPKSLDFSTIRRLEPPAWATPAAQRALGRELKRLQQIQATTPLHELGWFIDFDNVENMFQWIVELHSFEDSLPLAQDMQMAGVTSIVMEVRFGRDWPVSPPFVRIIRPRFLPFISGGGGHVTGGGAMCMELLTNSGWSPANSLESVFLQVRMALCNLEPRPARLENTHMLAKRGHNEGISDYGIHEAVEAYIRVANTHGWEVPKDFKATAYGTADGKVNAGVFKP